MAEADKLTQEQKAAAVIVSLGVDKASKLYKHLGQEDLERLTVEIARLGHIEAETTETVLDEFYKECLTQKVVTDGGIEYARTVLEKAFGEETANTLLQKVSKSLKVMPFAFLSKTNSKNLFSILQHERPQTIALVLSYVEPTQAADVIVMLPDEMKLRVVTNIAKMDSASPEAIKLVEAEMQKKFSTILTTDFTHVGGVDYIAEVMNNMDRSNEKSIFEGLNREDEELSAEIRKQMFVFEDILTMDARSIQRFLRDCDQKDLVLALKGTTAEVANVIFANVSSRMAENIKSDLEITVNVRLQDVEVAQQRIVQIIRTLEDRGEGVIKKGGKGDIIA